MASDMTIPDSFTFRDESVAAHFDDHVREQLPWYDLVTRGVAHLVRAFLPEGGTVIDIGASTGNLGRHLEGLLIARSATYIALEPSEQMRARYVGPDSGRLVNVPAETWEPPIHDVAVFMLSAIFIPPHARVGLFERYLQRIRPGGALISVDRYVPEASEVGLAMTRMTIAEKLHQGAAPAAVLDKELSISGVQRPLVPNEVSPAATEWFRFGDFRGVIVQR